MDLLFENVLKFNFLFILIPLFPLFHLVNEFISQISRNLHIFIYMASYYIWLYKYGNIHMHNFKYFNVLFPIIFDQGIS